VSAKQAAILGAVFGGAWGGLIASATAQYLSHDAHYVPLIAGALAGAAIAGLFTALVACNSLSEPDPQDPPADNPTQ
jgi:hypothetical protein